MRFRAFPRLPRSAARIRADIDDEIEFDIEMRARDFMRLGVDPRSAYARAAHHASTP
jgi:hypothetical protein